ncbi:hypothetical protein SO802_018247 [Lithocarpus litseifolius]|uniref:Uncharacterized protein n=1 Tax=Lithocarpus litseifolius TaxID=425828 RepID=A0AAW2CPI9_9ROSI
MAFYICNTPVAKMMSKLFRSNSTSSLASRSTSLPEISQKSGIIHSEEYEFSDVDLKLGDWNLPKTDFHIRTIEQVYGINKEYETCYLFSPAQIKAHIKKGHHFLHIGLVQVGVKPLIRSGLNNSILLALRNTRHIRFNDGLLGTIETSLSNEPVHFECFPNFTVYLHDPHVMKALTINIKTHGTLMVQGTSQLALIYRVYYKCIKTNMNVGTLDRKKIQNPDQDSELDFIQQLADGSVRLSFDKSRFKSPLDDYRPRSPIELSRTSLPYKQPPILLRDRPTSQASSSRPLAPFPRSRRDLGPEFEGVKTRSQVCTPYYTAKQESVVDQDDNNSQKTKASAYCIYEPNPKLPPLVNPGNDDGSRQPWRPLPRLASMATATASGGLDGGGLEKILDLGLRLATISATMELTGLALRPGLGHNGARRSRPPSWRGFVDRSVGLVGF